MAVQDGSGWVECRCGLRHWGLHGAAGLLVVDLRPGPSSDSPLSDSTTQGPRVLMQLRAGWTHQGGTWGLPGGARDSHEDVVTAALREAEEEVGVDSASVVVVSQHPGVDHGDWRYTYVLATAGASLRARIRTSESDELRWVALDGVTELSLHPALELAWPALRTAVEERLVRPRPR